MPVVRVPLSVSQFSELVGIEPARFNGVEVDLRYSRVTLVLEPEDEMAQTSGTLPQLADTTSRRKPGKGKGAGKKGC